MSDSAIALISQAMRTGNNIGGALEAALRVAEERNELRARVERLERAIREAYQDVDDVITGNRRRHPISRWELLSARKRLHDALDQEVPDA